MSEPTTPDLLTEVTAVLTRAAQATVTAGSPADFAALLCRALVTTADNVGGPHALLGTHPGSLEAAALGTLLDSAITDSPLTWLHRQVDPVIVRVTVSTIVEDPSLCSGLLGLNDALTRLDRQHQVAGQPGADEENRYRQARVALEHRYRQAYADYGARFTAAVHAAAPTLLTTDTPVQVIVDADPHTPWWEAEILGADIPTGYAYELWLTAVETIALPNVDIDLTSTNPGLDQPPNPTGQSPTPGADHDH